MNASNASNSQWQIDKVALEWIGAFGMALFFTYLAENSGCGLV